MCRISMSSLLLLACLLSCINHTIHAQSYVPQVSPTTSCPPGERFVTFGSNDVTRLATNTATTLATASYLYTTYFNVSESVRITQLSLGINDNLAITSVAQLRLGLMMITGTNMVRIAQSEEILLYATTRDIIYADLEQPAQLLPNVQYAITFWSSASIYTGVDTVPTGTAVNTGYLAYSSNGLPYTQLMSYTYGKRALQATGCAPIVNPFTAPDTQLYTFCSYTQYTIAPSPANTYLYSRNTNTHTISGILAVSTTNTGSTSAGNWAQITAGYASYMLANSGPWYYPGGVGASSAKVLVLGNGGITTPNQRLFTSGSSRVDSGGISLIGSDNTQYVISFSNNSIAITESSRGSMVVMGGPYSGMTISPYIAGSAPSTCAPPSIVPRDEFACESGEAEVSFGDDSAANYMAQYSATTNYAYSNFVYFREFTARPDFSYLKQLTFRLFDNPGKLAKIRMGIYVANGQAPTLPTYTLLAQTREVLLVNPNGLLAINLLENLQLVEGYNYSIAMITDHFLYCSYGYYAAAPYHYSLPYDMMAPSSMPQSVKSTVLNYVMPMGANGCARQQTIRTVEFCANFVYSDRINQYYGLLNVLANPRTSDKGQYFTIVSGSGISNRTTTANVQTIGNWTVKNYNLPSNNRLYLSGQSNNASPVDESGLQIVVAMPLAGYAVQIASWRDPASASIEFKEYQQTYSSSSQTALAANLMSDFAFREHGAGQPVVCNAPPRPRNTVTPASVARVVCPNQENAITDTFGDANIADFQNNADGTTIEPNRIYTNSFVAESSGTVRQLAIGILKNTDRVGEIRVRLGLYSAANNSLMVQANQLALNEAVDQLIVINLPYNVQLVSGQQYYIALIASATLEVATSGSPNSPSMTTTFATTGLPTTFVSSGNAVSVSIAAYVCVSTTHSFCAYYQYSPSIGASTTLLYQGLLQAGGAPQTNGYGTYLQATALAGRLTTYTRTSTSPTNTLNLFTFTQRPGAITSIYTSSTNGVALDSTGVTVDLSNGGTSQLQYNLSIGKLDESFRFVDKETDLIYSGIRITEVRQGGSIPSCGLSSVPKSTPEQISPPRCSSGEEIVSYGDADQGDMTSNQEGVYSAPAQQIFLRQFTSHATRSTILDQVKFGIAINFNTVNRIRMGLYNANFTFMAGTNNITMYNPDDQILTAKLSTPQFLVANSVYYLAMWTEAAVYSGYSSVAAPSGFYSFSSSWPTNFENSAPNSQRAIGGLACTTNAAPPATNTGTDAATSSSSSSSNLSGGAVAGIVIGCVIGTNLLLLACLYLCCIGSVGAAGKGANWKHMDVEESRNTTEPSHVELGEVTS